MISGDDDGDNGDGDDGMIKIKLINYVLIDKL